MPDRVLEGLAFQKLHGNESLPVFFDIVVNGADVRMIECRGSMCFTLKASQRLGITCKFRRQEFKSDEAVEVRVFGLAHDTHAAPAEFLEDAIVGDCFAEDRVEIRHGYGHLRLPVWVSQRNGMACAHADCGNLPAGVRGNSGHGAHIRGSRLL